MVQRFLETGDWFSLALLPQKVNWAVPLHNWVRKEKQSHDETSVFPPGPRTVCGRQPFNRLAPVCTGRSACHRERTLKITLLNSLLLLFHMAHKILVLLAFPY